MTETDRCRSPRRWALGSAALPALVLLLADPSAAALTDAVVDTAESTTEATSSLLDEPADLIEKVLDLLPPVESPLPDETLPLEDPLGGLLPSDSPAPDPDPGSEPDSGNGDAGPGGNPPPSGPPESTGDGTQPGSSDTGEPDGNGDGAVAPGSGSPGAPRAPASSEGPDHYLARTTQGLSETASRAVDLARPLAPPLVLAIASGLLLIALSRPPRAGKLDGGDFTVYRI